MIGRSRCETGFPPSLDGSRHLRRRKYRSRTHWRELVVLTRFTTEPKCEAYRTPRLSKSWDFSRGIWSGLLVKTRRVDMTTPILVTGAAGRVGGIGRSVTELLLARGRSVRAMVRAADERAKSLRQIGAQVVVGDLLDLDSMHRAIVGCNSIYFGMSVSDTYLAATVNVAAVAKHHGVRAFINMSQMTLAQMSIVETTPSPQHKLHWLAEQALNWSGLPVVHIRPTVLMEGFFLPLARDSIRETNQIKLPLGEGKTSPVSVADVSRVIASALSDPEPHIGKAYHLTAPQTENMQFFAAEFSRALGRTIAYQHVPVRSWRDELIHRGLPIHLLNHLTVMADMHRAGDYNRISHDYFDLTGRTPLAMQDVVRNNAALFAPVVTTS
jgi:uncharacterized protein YbjT (DUF2867 family)